MMHPLNGDVGIVAATAEHAPQLIELGPRIFANAVRELGPFDGAAWRDLVPRLLEGNGCRAFIAVTGDRIVGVHMVASSSLLFAPAVVVVRTLTLWVHPEARGQRLATRLHAAAEEWGRALGARRMIAGVPCDYTAHAELGDPLATPGAAESFYRGTGYVSADANFIKEIF